MSVRCALLSGGIGGAKLALGLAAELDGPELAVIANVGDDFDHLGLRICPDLDTLLYTLSGEVNQQTGWGRRDETWQFLEAVAALGGETWFRLGDRDLATHVLRTRALGAGERLTDVTARLANALHLRTRLLPVADETVATRVKTPEGELAFQEYFVRRRAEPRLVGLQYAGAENASLTDEVLAVLSDAQLECIVIAPSNPWLSIGPMLAIPGLTRALQTAPAPVIAVSPIVAGAAIKGPTAKIMAELGMQVSALGVARHYRAWLDGFILDRRDAELAPAIQALGLQTEVCNTVMNTLPDKQALARRCLDFAKTLRSRPQ
jgi:LPPG:FO 2-phospho-L-lactate transferase